MSKDQTIVLGCLAGMALALLVVGVVSGTVVRHVIQVLPILMAIVAVARRATWGSSAAMPLFVFWAFIVLLIWLYLLGISRIASGHYTVIEIVLTVFMALFSVAGVWSGSRLGRSLAVTRRVMVFLLFGVMQLAAMRISFLEPCASR